MKTLTVGELKASIAQLPDKTDVIIHCETAWTSVEGLMIDNSARLCVMALGEIAASPHQRGKMIWEYLEAKP